MDRENFARFPFQNFDFQRFQGAAGIGPYMPLLTDEQEQRGSSFNYYGSQIFLSQIINEEQSSRCISPKLTSSIADASAAAAQNKKQYETLKKRRSDAPSWNGYLKRENFLIHIFGKKDKIVNSQCDRV